MKEYRVESCRPHRGWRVLETYDCRLEAERDAATLRRIAVGPVVVRVTEHTL